MKKIAYISLAALLALVVGVGVYFAVVGLDELFITAQARSTTMPENPHILYLAPKDTKHGIATDETMQAKGASIVREWRAARRAARSRPLDALIVDATFLRTMTKADKKWLLNEIQDGLTIVALGLEDDEFAQILGLPTLLAPQEDFVKRGPSGYRLFSAVLFATLEDRQIIEQNRWVERMIRGEPDPSNGIKYPTRSGMRLAQGNLNSMDELDLLFWQIRSTIQGTYEMRSEFTKALQEFKGN